MNGQTSVTPGGVLGRFVASAFVLLAWAAIEWLLHTPATLVTGQMAGRQFEPSNQAYVETMFVFSAFRGVGAIVTIVGLLVLGAVWWKYIKLAWYGIAAALVVAILITSPTPSLAFFETKDRTEIHTILPNESAFWIPDVGDNKSTQVQMDSEAYLNERKIAAKRFVIPHQKLTGSAGTSLLSGWDYFVPTGRLIIVDRTPFSREWVDAGDRGTSKLKEGFPCQTKGNDKYPGGLNVTAGISIGTSVLEKDAAKFLYRFGVNPPMGPDGKPLRVKGDASSIEADGKIVFTSVYYGRSVKEVMDDVGRKKVQTLVCNELAKRTLDLANNEMIAMMAEIEKQAKAYFASVGITLDFIGWGDTLDFDKPIQDAINRAYIAKQDEAIAKMLQPYAETIKALAAAQATRDFGSKTDGKLPTTYVGPAPEIASPLLGMPRTPVTPSAR